MQNKIKENIKDPEKLELLYRANKEEFEKAFHEIYPEIAEFQIAEFWKTRLQFDTAKGQATKTKKTEIFILIATCLLTGFLIQIPRFFSIGIEVYSFYERNALLIVLFGLTVYTSFTRDFIKIKQVMIALSIFMISALYINLLPSGRDSHSINLASIHLPLMLWCLYGLVFIDFDFYDKTKRVDYIKYNGDLAILLAIILIAGGILTGLTIALFGAIEIQIERFYMDYIAVWGAVSAPIVATFIIRKYPFITNKIAPIIASIFSPLVLITLVAYLISMLYTRKDPYNDRDFLIAFNFMLLGVMSIVVFTILETSDRKKRKFNELTLFALTVVTLIINIIALSAILYRLREYGFTPNRTAVLGSNLLVFVNLILIMIDLYRVNFRNSDIKCVERTVARYLPVYAFWTIFVVFIMPWIFNLS